jgi:hypothetical protein
LREGSLEGGHLRVYLSFGVDGIRDGEIVLDAFKFEIGVAGDNKGGTETELIIENMFRRRLILSNIECNQLI